MSGLEGKVLITGGTGFLGRGILRKANRENWDCEFTILSRDEHKQAFCKQRYPNVRYLLGDVTDPDGLYSAFDDQDVVIHAAAIKYIPEAEINVREAIRINVQGSMNVAHIAWMQGVKSVIGISTDKAAAPINVYGMTKALMERMFGEMAVRCQGTRFACCRYGNVVGSTGSVIPLFQQQAKNKGYITITDPEMTRYWISVDEAVGLIETTHWVGPNGGVVVPKPNAMHLMDLAVCAAPDVHVRCVGLRPGEKKHENLISLEESLRVTDMGSWYSLGRDTVSSESFVLSSSQPVKFLSSLEMEAMIKDAADV